MKTTIQIGTWNLQTKKVPIDFSHFIRKTLSPSPEFMVFGFQELHSQFSIHFPTEQSTTPGTLLQSLYEDLQKSVDEIHSKGAKYQLIYIGRRSALGIIILAKSSIKVQNIYSGSLGTGLLGFYHNKGAIGVTIEFGYPTSYSICFINCHLGPHQGSNHCRWRQEESDHILSTLTMRSFPNDFSGKVVASTSSQAIFMFGDMNFRLKSKDENWATDLVTDHLLAKSEIHTYIEEKNVAELLKFEELIYLREKKMGLLALFSEPPITFMPSYKKRLDNRKYDNKRMPAYTDRILYTTVSHNITPILYDCLTEYSNSDHDPIMGMYLVEFKGQCVIKHEKKSFIPQRLARIYKINRPLVMAITAIFTIFLAYRYAQK